MSQYRKLRKKDLEALLHDPKELKKATRFYLARALEAQTLPHSAITWRDRNIAGSNVIKLMATQAKILADLANMDDEEDDHEITIKIIRESVIPEDSSNARNPHQDAPAVQIPAGPVASEGTTPPSDHQPPSGEDGGCSPSSR